TNPSFGPCRSLDYELELGVWIGPGNELGTPIAIADAASHIAGFCLLNDWSRATFRRGNTSRWAHSSVKAFSPLSRRGSSLPKRWRRSGRRRRRGRRGIQLLCPIS